VLDVNGNGRLSQDELSFFVKKTGDVTDADLKSAVLRGDYETEADFKRVVDHGFDIEALCLFYSARGYSPGKNKEQLVQEKNTKLMRHEKLLRTDETTLDQLYGVDSTGVEDQTRKLCVHCALVAKAYNKGITGHKYFLGDIEDPIFPLEHDRENSDKNMEVVARGFLDSNYRQPARIADVAASQHSGGGQKGAVEIHHVDDDSVDGRAIRYADVKLSVNMKHAVRRLVNLDATTARKRMQELTDAVCDEYVVPLTKELVEATACVNEVKRNKKLSAHPDVLVLAPRCADDPRFIDRLKVNCLKRNSRIAQLTNNGQIQFGTVGEWTGSDSPLVIITGFHQPYHLLTNVGCFARDHILAASLAEIKKWKKRSTYVDGGRLRMLYDGEVSSKIKQLGQQHTVLAGRLVEIPVDTLLYIAVTRATWGLSVVEPFARRFAAHYQIGKKGRRAGKSVTVQWSDDSDGHPKSRVLRNAQVLVDPDSDDKSLNMSGKDLDSVPKCVLDLQDTEMLNLSVNNLQRLPSDLWNLPLRTVDLSYNPCLGQALLSVFTGAAKCVSLQKLHLRAVVGKGQMSSDMNKLSLALRPLQKLELLDIRDNGLPFTLAAKLLGELPKCRIRIANCPGFKEDKKSLHFDEVIASQSTELDLSGNSIDDAEAVVLAEALNEMRNVEKLDLYANDIGAAGATALVEALKEMRDLKTLNLRYNDIGAEGAEHIGEALKVNKAMVDVMLHSNVLGAAGAQHISEALKVNQTITKLNLGQNRIGPDGAQHIKAGLAANRVIEELDLRDNKLGHEGAKLVSSLLQSNSNVTTVSTRTEKTGSNVGLP